MAKRKPKLTDVQNKQLSDVKQAYRRERQRIQQQINRMTKRGYDVPKLLPKIPKKITEASVRRLKKLTTEKLYKESRFIDIETGEILTGKQGQLIENKQRAQRAAQTRRNKRKTSKIPPQDKTKGYQDRNGKTVYDVEVVQFDQQVLTVFIMEMTEIFGRIPKLFNYITAWFTASRFKYGDEELAEVLQQTKESGGWPGWECISDEELLRGKLTAITDLMAINRESREEMFEELEQLEDWTEGE